MRNNRHYHCLFVFSLSQSNNAEILNILEEIFRLGQHKFACFGSIGIGDYGNL